MRTCLLSFRVLGGYSSFFRNSSAEVVGQEIRKYIFWNMGNGMWTIGIIDII